MRMRSRLGWTALLLSVTATACIVRPRPVIVEERRECVDRYWKPEHYDREGRFHPGHWVCP